LGNGGATGQPHVGGVLSDTAHAFPATVSKKQKTSRSTPNEIQKKEPRLLKQFGQKNNQEELNLSPQRAVQLLIPPDGLG
jgi:hypothetical protein